MSDGAFPDRVTLLRNRWEADPSSRVFLQLAEEYRHQGRVKEALEVLDRGLKEHPGYLSALVAKGRCHLELGEPESARTVLERVVKQDATQMVANKLLVRAYLETSEPERARERLDLYSLLNDSDPEIDELRRRLRAMEQPPQGEKPGSTPPSPQLDSPFAEVFFPAPPRREAAPPAPPPGVDIFDLGLPVARSAVAVSKDEPFADLLAPSPVAPPPAAAAAAPSASPVAVAEVVMQPQPPEIAAEEIAAEPAAVEEPEDAEEPEPADVVFPGLASRDSRRRYLASLEAEGLFLLDLTAAAPAVEARMQGPYGEPILARAAGFQSAPSSIIEEPTEAAPEGPWAAVEEPAPEAAAAEQAAFTAAAAEAPIQPEPAAAPVFDFPEPAPWAVEPLPPLAEPPDSPKAEPIATATLGELYLRQGHIGEAERIFREVLRREPGSVAAQEGLARAAARPAEKRPAAAHDLLAGYEPSAAGGEGEARARKRWALNSYLQRLRRGSQRDVS